MKPETRKLLNEGRLKMTNPMDTWDHPCVDCGLDPIPFGTEPCPSCHQYVCEKCSDPTEGFCLACPKRAREEQARGPGRAAQGIDLGIGPLRGLLDPPAGGHLLGGSPPVTYELLAKMIVESENRIRYDQMMKRRAFEERIKMQYRKELDQIREQVAELFKDLTPAA